MEWDDALDVLSTAELERLTYQTEIKTQMRSFADYDGFGQYNCSRCASPLYHSRDKFTPSESEIQKWPNFRAPISGDSVQFRTDYSFGLIRTEILCKKVCFQFNFFSR